MAVFGKREKTGKKNGENRGQSQAARMKKRRMEKTGRKKLENIVKNGGLRTMLTAILLTCRYAGIIMEADFGGLKLFKKRGKP